MKKTFGQICYVVGGTIIVTFLAGMTFGLTCRPDRDVYFSSTINHEDKTSNKKRNQRMIFKSGKAQFTLGLFVF